MVSGWFFIVHGFFQDSRLVIHCFRLVFMVIHGSRLIFHGSNFASRGFSCFQVGFLGSRLFFYDFYDYPWSHVAFFMLPGWFMSELSARGAK